MAKWDERDPRWIVEEREDAKNVNNWHWTERDVSDWSRLKLKTLFSQLSLGSPDETAITITEVDKISGEASINNRKGKLLFFYEWTIKLQFKAESADKEVTGYVTLIGLSFENTTDEIELEFERKEVEIEDLFNEAREIFIHKERHKLIEIAEKYKELLRTDATAGMQYTPKSDNSISTPELKPKVKSNSVPSKQSQVLQQETTTINLKEKFLASSQDIYECFTDAGRINAYTQRPCQLDVRVDGNFSMMDGIISGRFCKLIEGELIEQEWRMSDWPQDSFSYLQLKLEKTTEGCKLYLKQNNVPFKSAERTTQGWKQQIFQRIRMTFGYGVSPSFSL
ncbi:Activator of 90 kDa heat shock protein ATPase-like protein 1 isoform X1 [Oopsacas minuta]|uniref:Activator of 90 kDa heat shock protein ATPase-like protein 1 isoform X1 n=1 Tax=Oopsacas minuta TaxID=111878 RepID=A0AAV7JGK3_9METZ|nr:Activator of 90 kDa heat shock protein ATPase-like protein 1 isoform X1 [Oopsacas minuta]